jgi:uncharacterized membrane protein
LIFWLTGHWLSVFNTLAFVYVGLPMLAPVLLRIGATEAGTFIHTLYEPLCHQLPQRSFFLFGPQIAYTLPELLELAGPGAMPTTWSGTFLGNEVVGYKMALCQRDVAIYGAIVLFGLVYGLVRRWKKVRPLPLWAYAGLGLVPMGIDGGYQWLSYAIRLLLPKLAISPRESTPLLRVATGALFGLATVWLAYPNVQGAMDEFRETLHRRFGWE